MKTETTKILHFDRHSWHTIQLESCATRVQTISLDCISEGSRLATGTSERRRAIKKLIQENLRQPTLSATEGSS